MHRFLVLLGIVLFSQIPGQAFAGGGPENVLLVVNAEDETSRMVANWYQRLRRIPDCNVLFLSGIPRTQLASLDQGRDLILKPVLEAINSRKLGGQIDYVVYSTGFPTQVMVADYSKKLVEALKQIEGAPQLDPKIIIGRASLTSFTYFAASVVNDDPGFLGPLANNYYRKPVPMLMEQPFVGEAQQQYSEATQAINAGDGPTAVKLLKPLTEANPLQMAAHYRLAQAWAIQGDADQTSRALTGAVRAGWCYRDYTKKDPLLKKVIDQPLVKGFVDRIADEPFEFLPTIGCHSRFRWGPGGGINSQPDQGASYLMCTMLGTTWDHGNSEKEILAYLVRSAAADSTRPDGTIYFCETADVRTTTRKPNFPAALKRLAELGVRAEVIKAPLPRDADVAGVSLGAASFSWQTSGCTILPGAICENLTSYGGDFIQPWQTKLTELMRFGAAGSSGTVIEPYALQFKFPHPLIHVHYARGCSLAEAYYQSLSGPFQLLIVGDALCQPWARPPIFDVSGIKPGDQVSGAVSLKAVADTKSPKISFVEFFLDGRLLTRQRSDQAFSFDSRNLSDGFHELRVVAMEDSPIQSRAGKIIPVVVNNQKQTVKLTTEKTEIPIRSSIVLQVDSSFGDSVSVMHAGEVVGKLESRKGQIEIEAVRIGRGPADLFATVEDSQGRTVSSRPLSVNITGDLATEPSPLPAASRK